MAKNIQIELYNISRCVDDGNFHDRIENRVPNEITVTPEIPRCCKIELTNKQPPLHINIKYLEGKRPDLKVYISQTDV